VKAKIFPGRLVSLPGCGRSAAELYTGGMKFRIVIEYDPEVKTYSAVCPELPGCASAGDTEEEARANISDAIRLYLEPCDLELSDRAKVAEVTIG